MKIKVRAIPCETYTRVVGYYRPTCDMHKAKQEEVQMRKDVLPEAEKARGYGEER